MDIIKKLAEELHIAPSQAEAAVKLIDEGNTIPFIARYRKEATGSLNDEVLRSLDERLKYLRTSICAIWRRERSRSLFPLPSRRS